MVAQFLWLIACLSLIFPSDVTALPQFRNIKVIKTFADAILDPVRTLDQRGVNIFAKDVNGSIDILTDLSGHELVTDYIFGPFASAAQSPSTPSFFGRPVAYNVTGLAVQHSVVSASIVFDMEYALLNATLPLQVDGRFIVDEKHRISQFELSFKHWSWAMDTILPLLTPYMASTLGVSATTNSSVVLQKYLTMATCMGASTGCTGSESQYTDMSQCLAEMATKQVGSWDRIADDNLLCRAVASQLVTNNAGLHCPNLGPSGGDICQSRTYLDAAKTSLPASWNAAKYVTPENKHIIQNMQFVSGQPLSDLLEIALAENEKHGWDVHLYATATFGYFLFYYFFAKALWFVLAKTNTVFKSIEYQHQKNVVMYAMNIIFTLLALILELLASPAFVGIYHLWSIRCLRGSTITISSLYIFELIFRFDMRIPLTIHHVLTIVAISYAVVMFEWSQDPGFAISGIIWLLQATTEQPTFVGLMGYRLNWNRQLVAKILKISAIQTFIIKSASAIGLLAFWAKTQNTKARPMDIAWSALVFVIAVGLLLTQVWGSYVTYIIGMKISRKRKERPPITPGHHRMDSGEMFTLSPTKGERPGLGSGSSSFTKLDTPDEGLLPSLKYQREGV